jgi:SAM-dependent methyltransferase
MTGEALYSEAEIERWDREWLNYLFREYQQQLSPYTAYPRHPELPDDPVQMMDVSMNDYSTLLAYAPGSAIRGKSVMEFGCGCGNLGKLLALYADSYLGVDCSRLALAVARLVSPPNAAYVHVNDRDGLARHGSSIDTMVSRFFWIHQNFETGRRVLRIVDPLLKPGACLYLDFFWPNPAEAVGFWRTDVFKIRSPQEELDGEPSVVFQYSAEDVGQLFEGTPFRVIRQHEHGPSQRRYVVAEKI